MPVENNFLGNGFGRGGDAITDFLLLSFKEKDND